MKVLQRVRQFFVPSAGATLEAVYRRELRALENARRGVADMLANEKRLELEASSLLATPERATADATAADALLRRDRLLASASAIRAQRIELEELAEQILERVDRARGEKLALERTARGGGRSLRWRLPPKR